MLRESQGRASDSRRGFFVLTGRVSFRGKALGVARKAREVKNVEDAPEGRSCGSATCSGHRVREESFQVIAQPCPLCVAGIPYKRASG
jgi:hypothetical protein